jgi:hypothetical protein
MEENLSTRWPAWPPQYKKYKVCSLKRIRSASFSFLSRVTPAVFQTFSELSITFFLSSNGPKLVTENLSQSCPAVSANGKQDAIDTGRAPSVIACVYFDKFRQPNTSRQGEGRSRKQSSVVEERIERRLKKPGSGR